MTEVLARWHVSRETGRRLEIYVDLLVRWNGTLNLVGPRDVPLLWGRHIADALQLLALVPQDCPGGTDIGSGGGIPGIVVAIAGGIEMNLIEADRRKAAFLREVARATGAPVAIHANRAEDLKLAPAALVTARAVAELKQLLPYVHRHLAPDGLALLPKGRSVDVELVEASTAWKMSVMRIPSVIDQEGTILAIKGLRRA